MDRDKINLKLVLLTSITILYFAVLTDLSLFVTKITSSSLFFSEQSDTICGHNIEPTLSGLGIMTIGNILAAWTYPSLAIFAMGNTSLKESLNVSNVLNSDIPRKQKGMFLSWRAFLVTANIMVLIILFEHEYGSSFYDFGSNLIIAIISIFVQSLILFIPFIIYIILNNLLYTISIHQKSKTQVRVPMFILIGTAIIFLTLILFISFGNSKCV